MWNWYPPVGVFIARIKHSRWTMLAPIGLVFLGTFSGPVVRAACLVAAVSVSIWIFYDTELAKGFPAHSTEQRKWRTGAATIIFVLVAVGLFWAGNLIENWAKMPKQESVVAQSGPPIYDHFTGAYYEYRKQLGNPTTKAQSVGESAYQAKFQHATHIWTPFFLRFLVLHDDGHWERVPQDSIPDLKIWNDPTILREKFGRLSEKFKRPDCGTPEMSLAVSWVNNPTRWSNIGCRVWRCRTETPITYQEFENGQMAGVFRVRVEDNEGQVFVMFKDGTWESAHVTSPASRWDASDCIKP